MSGLTLGELAAELAQAILRGEYGRDITIWADEVGWHWQYGSFQGGLRTTLTWDVEDAREHAAPESSDFEILTDMIYQDLDVTFDEQLEWQERQTS